uniref:Uncharacterized protein n=1 Tax=Glossina palpalis gambiensis TaxID=67801 RepID=A0A1B0BWZ4_9MUSC
MLLRLSLSLDFKLKVFLLSVLSICVVSADGQNFDEIWLNDSLSTQSLSSSSSSSSSSLSFSKASDINRILSNSTYFDEPDSNDSDYNERIVDNVTDICLQRCVNEVSVLCKASMPDLNKFDQFYLLAMSRFLIENCLVGCVVIKAILL